MRWVETLVHVAIAPACVVTFASSSGNQITAAADLMACTLVLLALQHLVEGHRWQMTPCYIAAACQALLLATALAPATQLAALIPALALTITTYSAAVLLALSLALSAALCLLFPMFQLPAPSGPYPVAAWDLELEDPSRQAWTEPWSYDSSEARHIFVRLWYPTQLPAAGGGAGRAPGRAAGSATEPLLQQGAGAAGRRGALPQGVQRAAYFPHVHLRGPELAAGYGMPRFLFSYFRHLSSNALVRQDGAPLPLPPDLPPAPLLLMSHGYQSSWDLHTALCEELASQGYVVAAVEHPYCARYTYLPRKGRHFRWARCCGCRACVPEGPMWLVADAADSEVCVLDVPVCGPVYLSAAGHRCAAALALLLAAPACSWLLLAALTSAPHNTRTPAPQVQRRHTRLPEQVFGGDTCGTQRTPQGSRMEQPGQIWFMIE